MPEQTKAPKKAKSRDDMTTGLILLGVGIVFLLNNFNVFDISETWPLILVAVGVGLLAGAFTRKKAAEQTGAPQS